MQTSDVVAQCNETLSLGSMHEFAVTCYIGVTDDSPALNSNLHLVYCSFNGGLSGMDVGDKVHLDSPLL